MRKRKTDSLTDGQPKGIVLKSGSYKDSKEIGIDG